MSPHAIRLAPAAALALPVLAGLAWLLHAGAPQTYVLVNGAALVLALLCAAWLPLPKSLRGQTALATTLVVLLAVTALVGIEVDGVRRWLGFGPVQLHIGYLVLPLLVTLAATLPSRPAALLLSAAALVTALQPDRATCLALATSSAVLAWQRKDRASRLALAAALVAYALVSSRPDPLAPVEFVEQVQASALATNPAFGVILTIATFMPLLVILGRGRSAVPLAAFIVTAGLAAFIGAYPSILIGYGAAPILGFGLALAQLRRQ